MGLHTRPTGRGLVEEEKVLPLYRGAVAVFNIPNQQLYIPNSTIKQSQFIIIDVVEIRQI